MTRLNLPIPRDPAQCPPWLYEYLKRMERSVGNSATGIAQVMRGETPDGSGTPLPSPDLSGFFLLAGRSGGQIGRGGIAASEALQLSSTANTTKGFIHLGYPNARLTVDETLKLIGINKTTPAATLHIVGSDQGAGSPMTLTGDIDPTGTQWVPRGGAVWAGIGGTCAAAMNSDDANTSMAVINTGLSGNNPQRCTLSGVIVPGATYTVTIHYLVLSAPYDTSTNNYIGLELVDSTGQRWVSWQGNAGGSEGLGRTGVNSPPVQPCPGVTTVVISLTRTVVCAGVSNSNGTGGVPNSVNLYMNLQTGVSTLYGGITYIAIAQSGSPLMEWDFPAGAQSGGIDLFGRMGINTGSAAPGAELDIFGTSATLPALRLKLSSGQSADAFQLLDSNSKVLASIDSGGVFTGNSADVSYEDEPVFYEDDSVYYSTKNP